MNPDFLLVCNFISSIGFMGLMHIARHKSIVGLDFCILIYLFACFCIYFYGLLTNKQYYTKFCYYLLVPIFIMVPLLTNNIYLLYWHFMINCIIIIIATIRIFNIA